MIEVRPRGLVAGRRQCRGMRLSAVALLCSVGALAGCDTVARLAFLDNEFNEVQTLGLTPPVGACGGTTDGNATLRFVMLDSQRNTIGAGDSLGSQAVQFGRNDLALSKAALFDLPDEACDGSCDQMRLSCQVSDATFMDPSLARCNRQSAVSSQDPVFVGSRDKRLVFTLLMENTTSLTGRLPSEMSNLFPDSDGDGMTNAQWSTQALQEPERATDPGNARTSMASQILTSWKAMATRAVSARNSEAFFGMWTFGGGTAGLKSMLPGDAELVRAGSGAASGGGAVDTALASYASLPLRTEIASVYESMSAVLTNTEGMARADVNGADKLLVVFVDGPDELRNPLFSADKVITDAKAVGARVIIVHLDSSVTQQSPAMEPYFIDTPSYIERQTACASDASCHNFEECRKTTGYATAQGQAPTLPAGVDLSATFCHVKRDENGRVGPIDDYARIACETGGGYVYVPEPGQTGELGARAGWLPYVQDGLWEVPVTFDALARGDVEGGQGYKVQLEVSATVLDVQKPQSMSQLGLPLGNERDSRLVLFSGGQ